jgi:heterodisulfide reductase subunit C2
MMTEKRCALEISGDSLTDPMLKYVIETSGSQVHLCYQCHRCSAGCPLVTFAMDDSPSAIIHALLLGLRDKVMKSNTIWICASCKACSARCPQAIDVAGVMDSLRRYALKNKLEGPEEDINIFYRLLLQNIRISGKMYETGLLGIHRIKTGRLFDDLLLAFKLFGKGKLAIIPHGAKNVKKLRKLIAKAEELEKRENLEE